MDDDAPETNEATDTTAQLHQKKNMHSQHTVVEKSTLAGRINVLSLLNPEEPADDYHGARTDSRVYGGNRGHIYSAAFSQGDSQTCSIVNESDGYEMAPWRQESGLGPPESSIRSSMGAGQRYASSDNHHHRHHAEQQRNNPMHHPSLSSYDSSARALDAERYKRAIIGRGMGRSEHLQPRIFVPMQPILGHSATSKDKSGDYIMPCVGEEHHHHGMSSIESSTVFSTSPSPSPSFGVGGNARSQVNISSDTVTESSTLLGKRMRPGANDFSDDDEDDDDGEDNDDDDGTYIDESSYSTGPAKLRAASAFTAYPPPTSAAPQSARQSVNADGSVCRSLQNTSASTSPVDESSDKRKLRRTNSQKPEAARKASPPIETDATCTTLVSSALSSSSSEPEVDWKTLGVPEDIWIEVQALYEKVKVMKKVQNRQPRRMKPAILAALMFILCRSHGYPRTFAEICSAANVTKREIGMYYKLMNQVLDAQYTAFERAKPSAFLQRWCTALDLPGWIPEAASKIYERADEMGIVQGKSPVSISAASIWLVIWSFNHRRGLGRIGFRVPEDTLVSSAAVPNVPMLAVSEEQITCDQRDVCKAASVVIATLTSVFKLLLPHLDALVDGVSHIHQC
ncbi:hypothetical protein GGI15_004007 [Coemansia interrupta]|uniref:Transcription factor TFIIB cyclin-like domain-containing protein n=1 Tax=Coemansia interrupta TaxID=1126814 RepID=A0A9W8H9Y7_9FUNG|nr:hypothetical protein GGI15_004007 [Coemansia interrupta]